MTGPGLPPRAYPVPRDGEEQRFTNALIFDVAQVLIAHGYPEPGPQDLAELARALLQFIHGGRPE